MMSSQRALAVLVVRRPLRDFKSTNRRQWPAGCAAEPKEWSHIEIVGHANPQHAAARLVGERDRNRNVTGLGGFPRLELDVTNDSASRHYQFAAYRAHHAIGTRPRLAFELLLEAAMAKRRKGGP